MKKKNHKRVKIIKTTLPEPKKREFVYYYTPIEGFERIFFERKDKHDGAM